LEKLVALIVELVIVMSPIVESPEATQPPPIPDPNDERAVTLEFSIIINPILDTAFVPVVVIELDPEPIPDPHLVVAELIAVTNEFKISKPAIVQDPLLTEPPPIPLPIHGALVEVDVLAETAQALMQDSKIRMKPEIESPDVTDPVPIPEPPYPV
jgi:hypothetical protein